MSGPLPVIDIELGRIIPHDAKATAAEHIPLLLYQNVVEGSWPCRFRHLDFHSLFIAESGRGVHVIDSASYEISRGDLFVMAAGSDHTYERGEHLVLHGVHFSPEVFEGRMWDALAEVTGSDTLVAGLPGGHRFHLEPAAYVQVAGDLAELWTEWQRGSVLGAIVVQALLLRILVRLTRFTAGANPHGVRRLVAAPRYEPSIMEAVSTINLHYDQPLRVEQLAADANLSRHHFTATFKAVIGLSPRDYIRSIRLEHAKLLLATTSMRISDVALATGFRSQAYFAREFRAATALSPRQFRREAQSPRQTVSYDFRVPVGHDTTR